MQQGVLLLLTRLYTLRIQGDSIRERSMAVKAEQRRGSSSPGKT